MELNELEVVANIAEIINSVPKTAVRYLGPELSKSLKTLDVLQVGCAATSESDEEEMSEAWSVVEGCVP